jgi:hypothetical protein
MPPRRNSSPSRIHALGQKRIPPARPGRNREVVKARRCRVREVVKARRCRVREVVKARRCRVREVVKVRRRRVCEVVGCFEDLGKRIKTSTARPTRPVRVRCRVISPIGAVPRPISASVRSLVRLGSAQTGASVTAAEPQSGRTGAPGAAVRRWLPPRFAPPHPARRQPA